MLPIKDDAGTPADKPVELTANQCWDYIRQAPIGRLAVIADEHPEIFPINFVVDRGSVVFRTAEGTKLRAALEGAAVAFEVDGYDDRLGFAWSVVLKGSAAQLESIEEVLASEELPLFPWQAGEKNHFMRIEPAETSGRSFQINSAARRHYLRGAKPQPSVE
ncbi:MULTISPECIES: pyridoxamine 5'-phosphate oxidase family protein [Arthrobacter]|uniref:Pyridoxamine 5'-phosphate oxidase family protein n=1 Tax=Arthrobacter sunyaminii TaxID=2816859 RepID=A0A975PDU3_9MICC|nr:MULTISPECIES: pyridoxamine 5'-phosphate oxidase family protein [Arthrobacter]MBO0897542.1 pyridoxamine 5'-phosphate oxidase family protein [Arthrobacter sunyaminii]MBO0908536.1 pyridoxamine 5'-phosphate oxidase family protein [Arthrobacter sunyaminii]QWQ35925.1 pyridoxamine 5'-phosphate oxidase family protein [Arthrobacter sunyaminii]